MTSVAVSLNRNRFFFDTFINVNPESGFRRINSICPCLEPLHAFDVKTHFFLQLIHMAASISLPLLSFRLHDVSIIRPLLKCVCVSLYYV